MAKDFKQWIYHETNKPKIINSSEYEDQRALGWADSPAEFIKLEDVGIDKVKTEAGDKDETAKAQQALEAVEGVVQSLNNQLNIDVKRLLNRSVLFLQYDNTYYYRDVEFLNVG